MGYTMKEEIESVKLSYYGVDNWKNGEVVAKKELFYSNLKKGKNTVFGMLILKRDEKG